jgi:hypothetical protein
MSESAEEEIDFKSSISESILKSIGFLKSLKLSKLNNNDDSGIETII